MSAKGLKKMTETMRAELSYNYEGKEAFRKASLTFMRSLAKDLGLNEKKAYFSAGGPAVSGNPILMGMWQDGDGIYVAVMKDGDNYRMMYRTIEHMKDYTGGANQWISNIDQVSYSGILSLIGDMRQSDACA